MDISYKEDKQFRRDEERRVKALQEQDAATYFELCDKHGITPEDEDLYSRGQVDSEFLERREFKPSKLSKKASGKTGISVRNMDLETSRRIVRSFSQDGAYLRHLISEHVPEDTRIPVVDMSYGELLHYGRVIFGVAKKESGKHKR